MSHDIDVSTVIDASRMGRTDRASRIEADTLRALRHHLKGCGSVLVCITSLSNSKGGGQNTINTAHGFYSSKDKIQLIIALSENLLKIFEVKN